ncbi:hypothetical protein BKA67DRAFT_653086 [Truncatella angustata]|uniref:Uncharacterized protein n=1 Tax=Truncatella angustata TaxID=152316 RepID=A0A9P8UWV5_9PEZI|nr:uncharacterized protein BKA67DRAFT_653086 [Truncatella angustata]KAH6659878.1 hypothetical protein BKA67DRAFT_653086 [Truncatella angustata]
MPSSISPMSMALGLVVVGSFIAAPVQALPVAGGSLEATPAVAVSVHAGGGPTASGLERFPWATGHPTPSDLERIATVSAAPVSLQELEKEPCLLPEGCPPDTPTNDHPHRKQCFFNIPWFCPRDNHPQ